MARTSGIGTYKQVTEVYAWCLCLWKGTDYPVVGPHREEEIRHNRKLAAKQLMEHKKDGCRVNPRASSSEDSPPQTESQP